MNHTGEKTGILDSVSYTGLLRVGNFFVCQTDTGIADFDSGTFGRDLRDLLFLEKMNFFQILGRSQGNAAIFHLVKIKDTILEKGNISLDENPIKTYKHDQFYNISVSVMLKEKSKRAIRTT